ncbi:hypothetical protein Q4485_10290 [Granulosicoccaceae sp. 1_MG-2023]|nr:hypothetical protein [Granulosicoccaceae sp. 1_MG-2023]
MQETLRRQYLHAMGIDVWQMRVAPPAVLSPSAVPSEAAVAEAPVAEAGAAEPVPETPLPAVAAPVPEPEAPAATGPESLFDIDPSDFGDWLAGRPLMLLRKGDAGSFVLGPSEAPLLLLSQCQVVDKLTHQPFAGQAGRLLSNMLAAIDRPLYMQAELDSAGHDSDLLCTQLGEHQLRLLMLMAEPASAEENAALARLRGRIHNLPDGTQALVSYHPAWLLRNPLDKAAAWADLQLLRRALEAL